MNLLDIVLLILIAGLIGLAVYLSGKRKKNGCCCQSGGTCNCGTCAACRARKNRA